MTDTPDAALLWARERWNPGWGNIHNIVAEAFRAGQSHTQAALAARVERLEYTLQRMLDTCDEACDPKWVKRIARAALVQP